MVIFLLKGCKNKLFIANLNTFIVLLYNIVNMPVILLICLFHIINIIHAGLYMLAENISRLFTSCRSMVGSTCIT